MHPVSRRGATALLLLALAGGTWTVAPAARAQAAADEAASSGSLEEVQVTATRLEQDLPQDLAAAGVQVDTISGAAVQQGGYQDVAGALAALAPGLFILPKNGPFDYVQISMLGSRTQDVLWLVDGV